MRRSTRLILLLGCALVLFLGAPLTFSTVESGLRGPYQTPSVGQRYEPAPLPASGPARVFLRRDLGRR